MDQLRVGIIGCGYWGPNLIRNFVEIAKSEVVIVADLRDERLAYLKSSYPQLQVTKNYQDLFHQNLDAVVIATPPATHYKLAKESLEHGLHVLVEKPITINSQHAEKLIELAKANELVLMVGHTFAYNVAVHTLKSLIDNGELGNIYYVDSARLNLGLYNDLNVLWDLAPHDISVLLYLLNRRPISVSAHGTRCVSEGIHDVAYIDLMFPDDILAHVHVSWLDPCKVRRTTVVGSKKMVVYNDIEANEKIKIYDKGVDKPPYTDTYVDFQFSYRSGDVLIPYIRFGEPLRRECQHFLECIENHCEPLSGGKEGLEVVKVLEAAQRSLNNNCKYSEVIQW
jgi:predicted dehydrogenase